VNINKKRERLILSFFAIVSNFVLCVVSYSTEEETTNGKEQKKKKRHQWLEDFKSRRKEALEQYKEEGLSR